MTKTDIRLVYITTPDLDTATALASQLVEKQLVACANILPQMRSVYRWEGKVEQADECVLLCKTISANVAAITTLVADEHPYDLPAVIALPVDDGLPGFLDWIRDESQPKTA